MIYQSFKFNSLYSLGQNPTVNAYLCWVGLAAKDGYRHCSQRSRTIGIVAQFASIGTVAQMFAQADFLPDLASEGGEYFCRQANIVFPRSEIGKEINVLRV